MADAPRRSAGLHPDDPLSVSGVLVVGAGSAGLAAAYELTRLGVPFRVLEAGTRPGGVILTERVDEFLIDAGPDSLLAQKPAAIELARELGLGDRLQTTLLPRTAYVLRRQRLHPLPEASVMGIPTRIGPLVTSGLFSARGKLRMAADLVLARGTVPDGDESIGRFMRRRFGDEAVRFLAEPLLAGIHAGDVERLSIKALFPRLAEAEERNRSLILFFRRVQAKTPPSPDGIFRSFPGGIGELADAMVGALPPSALRMGASVAALERTEEGWTATLSSGERCRARAIILAIPAYAAARAVQALDPSLASLLAEVRYASSVTVALAYRRDQVSNPMRGSGFVVPRAERDTRIMAASWVSSKWAGRAPQGYALLRAFIGGARNPELLERDAGELAKVAEEDLSRLMGIRGDPIFARSYRWMRANAQHEVGHLARLQHMDERLASHPGLFLTGSAYRGTGITDCVADARRIAREAGEFLSRAEPPNRRTDQRCDA